MSVVAFVEKVNSKSGTNRNGKPYTLWSLKLIDKDGNFLPGYYQCGFDKPACKEGDYIKLEATKNDKGNFDVDVKSIKTSKNPPAKPAAPESRGAPAAAESRGGGQTQRNIHYQNSRTAAIELAGLLLENEAIKLVKADTKAGAASRFDIITETVDKLTVKLFNDLETFRLFDTVADFGGKDVKGDGELPDTEDDEEFEDDEFDNLEPAGGDDFEDEDDDFE